MAALAVLALRRTGHRLPMAIGFSVTAVGLAAMYATPGGVSPYMWLSIAAGVTGIGMGMTVPATNNASLQLAPDQVGLDRRPGACSARAEPSPRSRSPPRSWPAATDSGAAQADIFLAFAAMLILVLPLLLLVPDHHGSW